MGFLDKIRADIGGVCKTCGHLVSVKENLIGCEANDKLILPEYPPYHGNTKCPKWKSNKLTEQED